MSCVADARRRSQQARVEARKKCRSAQSHGTAAAGLPAKLSRGLRRSAQLLQLTGGLAALRGAFSGAFRTRCELPKRGGLCESRRLLIFKTAFDRFGGEAFGDTTWVDVTNQRTRHLGMASLLEVLENGAPFRSLHPGGLSGVVVNFGAGDGVCRSGHAVDPALCLIATGSGGVVFEANKTLEPVLFQNLGHRQPDLVIVAEAAEPATVSRRLAAALAERPGRPLDHREIDLIKIDVDGPDCELAAALVEAGWRPKAWHVEINPLFPPGVVVRPRNLPASGTQSMGSAFSSHPPGAPEGEGRGGAARQEFFVGCSLQALLDTIGPDYALVHVEYENAVLVRQDLAEALRPWLDAYDNTEKWRIGYFCNPLARLRQPHDTDEDSWFLRYDFRQWGDPSLSASQLAAEVEAFLQHFSSDDSHEVALAASGPPPSCASPPREPLEPEASAVSAPSGGGKRLALADPDCEEAWKGRVLAWDAIRTNVERVLQLWAGGGGDLTGLLVALTNGLAQQLNIDHAWPIFKSLSRGECPLGGLSIAVVLRWHCGSPGWEMDEQGGASNQLFSSMRHQLPMLVERGAPEPKPGFGNPAALGCEATLERYLEAALHRIDLSTALRSRWPVFELLSALHTESRLWPRGYP